MAKTMKFGVDKTPTKMPYSGRGSAVGAVEKKTKKIVNRSKKRPPQYL